MTWVTSDYVATQGSGELSVQKGQQVEVIDTNCLSAPGFSLVRLTNTSTNNNLSSSSLTSSTTQEQTVQEGLVPSSILKPPPTQMKNRRVCDADEGKRKFAINHLKLAEISILKKFTRILMK